MILITRRRLRALGEPLRGGRAAQHASAGGNRCALQSRTTRQLILAHRGLPEGRVAEIVWNEPRGDYGYSSSPPSGAGLARAAMMRLRTREPRRPTRKKAGQPFGQPAFVCYGLAQRRLS